ncbi:hypothetical protein [Planktomarina sp.]|uniref:hypothetical protein n=1 Tax=Planktomarina sp. TaxID=2024851 RepID=UPI003260AC57
MLEVFAITGAEAVGGMSGGGTFLDFDADGDGTTETYLVGTTLAFGRNYQTAPPCPVNVSITDYSDHSGRI